ncbi:MAG: amidohydrolase [Clostridium sp.]
MEKVYFNGKILTMEDENLKSAILVRDGVIAGVGTDEEILGLKTNDAEVVNLNGKTLMPAFIDPHSHITNMARALSSVDLGEAKSFDDIVDKISSFIKENNIEKGEWISGFNYDHTNLKEKKHPTKEVLDRISSEYPIIIAHASGHMGVASSLGLEKLDIDDSTENPKGGTIGRDENGKATGYLEENAFMNTFLSMTKISTEKLARLVEKAENLYASYGITTAQDGLMREDEFAVLDYMSKAKQLKLDVVGYVEVNSSDIVEQNSKYLKKYINRFKIGGLKMLLDGSPQGRTAWLSKPYKGGEKDYVGYPAYSDEKVQHFVNYALEKNIQLLAHCNGDAASEQYIRAFEKAILQNGMSKDTREVMIHCQTVRHDQLERMKKINMIPSIFIEHIYRWGDIHIKNLGRERANHISPAGYALKQGLMYNFHQDTPVLKPDMLKTIQTAVTRLTSSGVLLGEDERISVFDALKGITINAAFEYSEENKKGTLTKGKLADLVILDKNPLEVNKDEISKIKVLETIKEGKTIYKNI